MNNINNNINNLNKIFTKTETKLDIKTNKNTFLPHTEFYKNNKYTYSGPVYNRNKIIDEEQRVIKENENRYSIFRQIEILDKDEKDNKDKIYALTSTKKVIEKYLVNTANQVDFTLLTDENNNEDSNNNHYSPNSMYLQEKKDCQNRYLTEYSNYSKYINNFYPITKNFIHLTYKISYF